MRKFFNPALGALAESASRLRATMVVSTVALTALIPSIGVAEVLIGNPFSASGLLSLGLTEGEIGGSVTYAENVLTAPEWTGGMAHQTNIMVESATITTPMIVTDDLLYAKISPSGTKSGGWSSQQVVTTTSLVLIPRTELGGSLAYATATWTRTAGNGVAGASGAGAAPKHALWIWRCYPMPGNRPFRFTDGGKMIIDVTWKAMIDVVRPEGHKVFTTGDPAAQGITTILI